MRSLLGPSPGQSSHRYLLSILYDVYGDSREHKLPSSREMKTKITRLINAAVCSAPALLGHEIFHSLVAVHLEFTQAPDSLFLIVLD